MVVDKVMRMNCHINSVSNELINFMCIDEFHMYVNEDDMQFE